jgi:hypothetical protein
MRIKFSLHNETTIGLATIIGVCQREIERRTKAGETTKEEADAIALVGGQFVVQDIKTGDLYAQQAGRGVRPLPAGSGVKPPVLVGIDEKTGEINNDANAARQAFGGASANPMLTPPANANASAGSVAPVHSTTPAIASPATTAPAAPSASLPPATSAGGVATGTGTTATERDSKGVPWDERIHSRNQTKNDDGTWRYKRGVDEAVKTAVLAEIAGTVSPVEPGAPTVPTPPPSAAIPVPPASPAVSLPPGVPLPPATAGVPNAPQPVVVPTPPVNPTVSGLAQPSATAASSVAGSASPSKMTFPALVSKINQALAGSKITQDDIQLACSELGIVGVAALADPANAHLTDAVATKLFPSG